MILIDYIIQVTITHYIHVTNSYTYTRGLLPLQDEYTQRHHIYHTPYQMYIIHIGPRSLAPERVHAT